MPMTLSLNHPLAVIRNEASKLRYRWKDRAERYGRAWRYARRTMTYQDGLSMLYDAEHAAGIYGLEVLSADSVATTAREMYGDYPGITKWAEEAAARVSSKWSSGGHLTGAAEDWALNILREYAAEDGVNLSELDS